MTAAPQPIRPMQLQLLFGDTLISVAAAAHKLGCSRGKVMRLLDRGELRGVQVTGEKGWWDISLQSVEELIEKIHAKYLISQQ